MKWSAACPGSLPLSQNSRKYKGGRKMGRETQISLDNHENAEPYLDLS